MPTRLKILEYYRLYISRDVFQAPYVTLIAYLEYYMNLYKQCYLYGDGMTESTKAWFSGWSNEYDQTLGKIKRHHEMQGLKV